MVGEDSTVGKPAWFLRDVDGWIMTLYPTQAVDSRENTVRRRSIRLPRYDYAHSGAYFVTICTLNQVPILGNIEVGGMILSQEGKTVKNCLGKIPHHYSNCTLDTVTIMPNHLHVTLVLTADRRGEASAEDSSILPFESKADASPLHHKDSRPRGTKKGSLGAIIQNFKSVSTRKINQLQNTPGNRIWQRNYFEHIIRTERSLNAIRRYVMANPSRWEMDRYNPKVYGIDLEAEDLWNLLREDVISKELERLL
jgi:REP element-mobilizing transposase RayT